MATNTGTQGGTHEQHVKSGEQSHKKTPAAHDAKADDKGHEPAKGTQGGTHEQHVKAGEKSHASK